MVQQFFSLSEVLFRRDAEESGAEESGAEESGAEESGVFLGGEESKTVLVFDLMTGAALDHDAKSQVVLQMTGV